MPTIANVEMAAAWDGAEGAHWAEHADRYERAGWRIWERFVDGVPIAADAHVLDIGCGTGKSTRALARIAAAGSALGVDLSAQMLGHAREAAKAEGVTNVSFEQGDAQVHPFPPAAFDVAVSSFGAMFFSDPVAAFTNIGQGLRPGGQLALLAWRELGRNEWLTAVRGALACGRQLPEPPPSTPGPFGLADDQHVRRVLGAAGFVDVQLEAVEQPIEFGADADDALLFVRTMGITKGLTQDLSAESKEQAIDALHRTLAEHETADGVLLGTSAWLITARAGPS